MKTFDFWESLHKALGYLSYLIFGMTIGVFICALAMFTSVNPWPKTLYPFLLSFILAIQFSWSGWGIILMAFVIERIVAARKTKHSSN
jgi:uncharacterized membrane protein